MGRKIVIEPLTRVEGHGKVTVRMDSNDMVEQSRLHIVEFRGFERFLQERPYWEIPVIVQRLCGICPVSHHLAAAKAMDVIVGAGTGDGLTPTAEKVRRLMHYGQMLQSHALHFFHLSSPDFLFGADGDPAVRNIVGVALEHRELAIQGVMMRKYGQEVVKVMDGKKIHGTGGVPGGVNKNVSPEEKERLLNGPDPLNADKVINWSQEALEFFRDYHSKNKDMIDNFAVFPSNHLSIVRKDGAMDFYHGVLRAVDPEGKKILNDVEYQDYIKYINEDVKSWSYMKFPFLTSIGRETGWYTVGPLARLNTADFIPSPLAQKEFENFKAYTNGKPNNMSMHMHWARLIEVLHSAEVIKELLNDPDIHGNDLVKKGTKQKEGVGIVEAPRGTLFHHYRINNDDQIDMANLIVSTTNNNEAMNRAVDFVAKKVFNGHKEITEGMMNRIEMAVRAYDPCLSCATHALGNMPLEVTLTDSGGKIIDQRRK